MIHSRLFIDDRHSVKYQAEQFQTRSDDRPLIVQFCANDPETLLKAAQVVEPHCDGVDINLGCPQDIARRGHYGSFLQDEWDLIEKMVKTLHVNLKVPVTCKIRIFPQVEKSIAYAKMLESAGCQLLTVHGRIREQRGHKTGLADWEQIRLIKQAISIPVFANGNILYFEDIQRCIEQTSVDGVMLAEANLYHPTVFCNTYPSASSIAREYLEICEQVPTKLAYIRAHLFKLFHRILPLHTDLRADLAKAKRFEQMQEIVSEISRRLEDVEKSQFDITLDDHGYRDIPYWLCQPYIRQRFPQN